jgi:hypothetical protein
METRKEAAARVLGINYNGAFLPPWQALQTTITRCRQPPGTLIFPCYFLPVPCYCKFSSQLSEIRETHKSAK